MRQLSVIATILCILVSGCRNEDKKQGDLWRAPRAIEPMTEGAIWAPCNVLPLTADRVLPRVQCSPPPSDAPNTDCGAIDDPESAAQAIATCTDAAIAVLRERTDTFSRAHLAAALHFRAREQDRPQDLLPARDTATAAAAMKPLPIEALFNRALIEEALGMRDQAIASWTEFARLDGSDWETEARAHLAALEEQRRNDAAIQWPLMPARIEEALSARDYEALQRSIEQFPLAVTSYLLETILPAWAEDPSEKKLESARFLAEELFRFNGDPYPRDIVAAIANARDQGAVKRGLLQYRALRAPALFDPDGKASYATAADLLARGNNPLSLEVRAHGLFQVRDAESFATLDRIEREAVRRKYLRPQAVVHLVRVQNYGTRFLDALRASEQALMVYPDARDLEHLAKTYARRAEVFRLAGQNKLAWREIVRALRHASRLHVYRDRNFLLGEATKIALELGHPEAALSYADTAVTLFRGELQRAPVSNIEAIRAVQQQLALARRWRAAVLVRLGRTTEAVAELEEADRLFGPSADGIRRLFGAPLEAVRGDALLRTDSARAHVAFTMALEQTKPGESHAPRAWLFAQRGEARRRMKLDPEGDLTAAIRELEAEQDANLAARERGEGEAFWSAYMSRFPEPHQRLIQYYADEQRFADAFRVAERARAYEPLQLALQLPDVPAGFRELVADGGVRVLQGAQKMLPPGTFILQYSILHDRTYVFIIGKDVFEVVPLTITARQVEDWGGDIRRAIENRRELAFARAMERPYALVAEPLRRLARHYGGQPHLAVVPDGAMHGMSIAAFRDPATKKFLIDQALISTAPSTALYLHSRLRDAALPRDANPAILLVGNPKFHANAITHDLADDLPSAEAEVRGIRNIYQTNVDVLTGAQATIPAFLARAENKAIVHFAGHSIAVEDALWQSMLVLAPSSDHPTGLLTADELVKKQQWTRTRLMVLSSCSSASGSPVGAEGVAPLMRPLLGAGVPAVIGSLWDVEDATAKRFLVSFHRHYEAGSDAAGAMQRAQRELTGNINDVFKWAGFQLIGHASSPSTAH